MSTRRRPVNRVEDLATELFGVGAAVSEDREPDGWLVRVWDRHGELLHEERGADKREAARRMIIVLERASEE